MSKSKKSDYITKFIVKHDGKLSYSETWCHASKTDLYIDKFVSKGVSGIVLSMSERSAEICTVKVEVKRFEAVEVSEDDRC